MGNAHGTHEMPAPEQPTGVAPSSARSLELRDLAEALREVTRQVDTREGDPMDRLAAAALDALPTARAVSLTVLEQGRFSTRAATDRVAEAADDLQYALGRGPCVDAALEDTTNVSNDLATDDQWGAWGPRVSADLGVPSVLAHRLVLPGEQHAIASLNVYGSQVGAFDEEARHRGVVLATHGSLLIAAVMAQDVASRLAASLQSNREVGVAMGMLMQRHGLTRDQAFDLLRLESQESSRSVAEVAESVAASGDLALIRWPLGGPRARTRVEPPA